MSAKVAPVHQIIPGSTAYPETKEGGPPAQVHSGFGKFTPTSKANSGSSLENPGKLCNNEAEVTARMYCSKDLFEPFAEGVVMKKLGSLPFYQAFDKDDQNEKMYARLDSVTFPFPAYTHGAAGWSKTTARMKIDEKFAKNIDKLARYLLNLSIGESKSRQVHEITTPIWKDSFSFTIKDDHKTQVYLEDGTVFNNMPNIPAGTYKNVLINFGIYFNNNAQKYSLSATLLRATYFRDINGTDAC